jgi:hypothetical protein
MLVTPIALGSWTKRAGQTQMREKYLKVHRKYKVMYSVDRNVQIFIAARPIFVVRYVEVKISPM